MHEKRVVYYSIVYGNMKVKKNIPNEIKFFDLALIKVNLVFKKLLKVFFNLIFFDLKYVLFAPSSLKYY